jgi:hypothetical protein
MDLELEISMCFKFHQNWIKFASMVASQNLKNGMEFQFFLLKVDNLKSNFSKQNLEINP